MTTQSLQRSEAFGPRVPRPPETLPEILSGTLRRPGDPVPDRRQATLGEPVITDPDDARLCGPASPDARHAAAETAHAPAGRCRPQFAPEAHGP